MACKAEHHNSTQCMVPYQSSPRIRENWDWKDAEGGISSIPLDKCRISYSPSQIWNFILNPISIVDPQHSESRMEQVETYEKTDRRPSSPCPVCIFQVLCDSQGKTSPSSGDCYHELYLTIAVLSLRQLDMFQFLYKSSKLCLNHRHMLSLKGKMAGFNKVQFSEYSFGSGEDTEKNKSEGDGNKETHVYKHC